MNEMWILFLDDIRSPVSIGWGQCEVARTCEQAQALIEKNGLPLKISFDHDLGDYQPPATALMWWLIDGHQDEKWNCADIKEVLVHSANPVGSKNLLLLWEGFCKSEGIECEIYKVKAWEGHE